MLTAIATEARLTRDTQRSQRWAIALIHKIWRGRAIVLGAAVITFLAWPMLFTSSGMAQDWTHHLWYVWRQGVMMARNGGRPSLFLNDGGAVFYPLYAFYGGTIYALFGGLAAILGEAPLTAYVFSYLLGFTASYFGWYQLARMAGLGRWWAQVPGFLFISSPYYLTLIYARGDWPEFLAVSSMTLFVAAALRVATADRLRLRWACVLAATSLVLFGSHNISMLWGATAIALAGCCAALFIPRSRSLVKRGGALRAGGIVVCAALVNAWYLFPTLAYAQRSGIAKTFEYASSLRGSAHLVSTADLFTLSRASVVPDTPDFVLTLPVFAIVLVGLTIVASTILKGGGVWRRVLLLSGGLSLLYGILMTHPGLILDLPKPYTLVQFSYRLETYVLLGLCGAVLAALALTRSWPKLLRWAWTGGLAVAVIASLVGAITQVDAYPRGNVEPGIVIPDRYSVFSPALQPPFSGGLGDYNDASLPLVEPAGQPIGLNFPTAIRDERVTVPLTLPAGTQVHTNLSGAPYLVKVDGARVVGHDVSGHMVLAIDAARGSQGEHVTLSRSDRLPLVAGRLVAELALLALGLGFVGAVAMRLYRRRRSQPAAL